MFVNNRQEPAGEAKEVHGQPHVCLAGPVCINDLKEPTGGANKFFNGVLHVLQDLVFALIIAKNQLVTLVRMRKYYLHPMDLHLIINLVNASESFKEAESWTPICLPKFDARLGKDRFYFLLCVLQLDVHSQVQDLTNPSFWFRVKR